MTKKYITPELKVAKFDVENVVTESSGGILDYVKSLLPKSFDGANKLDNMTLKDFLDN